MSQYSLLSFCCLPSILLVLQVVNTLLPTPSAPRINVPCGKSTAAGTVTATTGVWDTRVRLRWDTAAGGGGAAPASIGVGGLITRGGGGGAGGGGTANDKAAAKILMQVGLPVLEYERRGGGEFWGWSGGPGTTET